MIEYYCNNWTVSHLGSRNQLKDQPKNKTNKSNSNQSTQRKQQQNPDSPRQKQRQSDKKSKAKANETNIQDQQRSPQEGQNEPGKRRRQRKRGGKDQPHKESNVKQQSNTSDKVSKNDDKIKSTISPTIDSSTPEPSDSIETTSSLQTDTDVDALTDGISDINTDKGLTISDKHNSTKQPEISKDNVVTNSDTSLQNGKEIKNVQNTSDSSLVLVDDTLMVDGGDISTNEMAVVDVTNAENHADVKEVQDESHTPKINGECKDDATKENEDALAKEIQSNLTQAVVESKLNDSGPDTGESTEVDSIQDSNLEQNNEESMTLEKEDGTNHAHGITDTKTTLDSEVVVDRPTTIDGNSKTNGEHKDAQSTIHCDQTESKILESLEGTSDALPQRTQRGRRRNRIADEKKNTSDEHSPENDSSNGLSHDSDHGHSNKSLVESKENGTVNGKLCEVVEPSIINGLDSESVIVEIDSQKDVTVSNGDECIVER